MEKYTLDPRSEAFADPQMSLLFGQVEQAQQWLIWLIQGCEREKLEYRGPAGDRNSIATLVLHIAGCNLHWVYRMFQEQPVPSDLQRRFVLHDGEGPMPEISGLTAAEHIERHRESVRHVKQYLLTLSAPDLDRKVTLGPDLEGTFRWGIWHLAEHSMLHQGHIRWLRLWYRDSP